MRPKYIMNEKKYVEDVILNKKYEIDKDFSKDLFTLIKYYCQITEYDNNKSTECINKFIEDKKMCKNDWKDFIDKTINICIKNKKILRELDVIHITKEDYDVIDSLGNKELKKTLFTFIILAKLINYSNPNESKITYTFNEIFTLANLSGLKRNVRQDIIKQLKDKNLIDTEVIRDNKTKERKIIYKVLCIKECNDNIYFIKDMSSLGKRYIEMKRMLSNRKLKQCERCGCLIEKNDVGNPQRYCIECAKIINVEKQRIRDNNRRNLD